MLWQLAASMVHQYIIGRYISFGKSFSIVIVKDKKFFALNTWLRHVPSRFTQSNFSHQPSKPRPFVGRWVRIFFWCNAPASHHGSSQQKHTKKAPRSLSRLWWKVIPFLPTSAKHPFSSWTSRKTGRVSVSLGMIWYPVAVCCNRHAPKSMLSNQPCTVPFSFKFLNTYNYLRTLLQRVPNKEVLQGASPESITIQLNWHPFERSYRVSSNMFLRTMRQAPSNYHLHFFSDSNEVTRIKDTSFQSKSKTSSTIGFGDVYII